MKLKNATGQQGLWEAAEAFHEIAAFAEHAAKQMESRAPPPNCDLLNDDKVHMHALQMENDRLKTQLSIMREQLHSLTPKAEPGIDTMFSHEDHESAPTKAPEFATEAYHLAGEPQTKDSQGSWIGTIFSTSSTLNLPLGNATSCIFDSNHGALLIFSMFCGTCVILGLWADTLGLVQSWHEDGSGPLGRHFEILLSMVFSLEILMTFNTSYEDHKGVVRTSRRKIARNYLKTWFAIDIIAVVPWDALSASKAEVARLAKVLKLIKLVRAAKIIKSIKSDKLNMITDFFAEVVAKAVSEDITDIVLELSRFVGACAKFCFSLLVQAHLLTCLMLASAEGGSLMWEYRSMEPSSLTPWLRYFVAMRWSTMACAIGTTVDPVVELRAMSIDPQLLQTIIVLLYAVNLLAALAIFSSIKGFDDSDFSYRVHALNVFLRRTATVSVVTRRTTLSFLRAQMKQQRHQLVMSMIDNLPSAYQHQLTKEMYKLYIDTFRPFGQGPFQSTDLSDGLVIELCTRVKIRCHAEDAIVISKNAVYDGMWWIHSGKLVRLEEDTFDQIQRLGPKKHEKLVGFQCLFSPEGHILQCARYSLKTVGSVELLVLTRDDFDKVIAMHSQWSAFVQYIRNGICAGEITMQDLQQGLPDDFVEKFYCRRSYVETNLGKVSENLGVGAGYLLNFFKGDVEAELGEAKAPFNSGRASFSELAKYFWSPDHPGFKGSAQIICPRDNVKGSAIVDALDDQFKGRATHFVSWTWAYTVNIVVSSLNSWAEKHGQNCSDIPVFFWMCFFCNNQRKVLLQKSSEDDDLAETFGTRLLKIGCMIIILDNFQAPRYTTRLWCIYELYEATDKGIPIEVTLPYGSQKELQENLEGGQFAKIADSLANLDGAKAEASHPQDEERIKNTIRATIGFHAVNQTVKCALTRWLALAFQDSLEIQTISDVAQSICKLVNGDSVRHSTNSNLGFPNDSFTGFQLTKWREAANQYPFLVTFLGPDPDRFQEFLYSKCNEDGMFSVDALDHYLRQTGKCNMHDFLCCLPNPSGDILLQGILQKTKKQLLAKVERLRRDASHCETVLSCTERFDSL